MEAPLRVEHAEVARAEVALGVKRLGIILWVAVIPWCLIPGDQNLANFPRREDYPCFRVDDTELHTGQRLPLGMQPQGLWFVGVRHRGVTIRLGGPVDVANLPHAQPVHGERHLLGRANGQASPQRPGVSVPPGGGHEHSLRHMAHAIVDRTPFGGDQAHSLFRVEALLQHDRPAVREERHKRIRRGKTPKQRHRQPQAIGAGEMLALTNVEAIFEAPRVRQGDAFGPGGTA